MINIIVVDDEVNALHDFLNQIISYNEVNYRFFKDDADAIREYVKNNQINGAFLDINMPGINGIELAKKLVKINRDIRIAFVTGLNVTKEDLPKEILNNVIDIVYKPYTIDHINIALNKISDSASILEVKMFGDFDCFINKRLVKFSSSKSKELFALLLVYNGKSLSMNNAITALWPDKDLEKSKKLYRDAVWRLRETLNEIGFNCVEFGRANLSLNKENIHCDYYDYLSGKDKKYHEEFLNSYEWSLPYELEMSSIYKKRKK